VHVGGEPPRLDTLDGDLQPGRSRHRGGRVRPPHRSGVDPDVHVRDIDTAAELIIFTVELNTHKLMADPRTIPVETFENELVDMVTRYLRGDRSPA
jgi:hypothetical protein